MEQMVLLEQMVQAVRTEHQVLMVQAEQMVRAVLVVRTEHQVLMVPVEQMVLQA